MPQAATDLWPWFESAMTICMGSFDPDADADLFRSAATRMAAEAHGPEYTPYYLRNIARGRQPLTEIVGDLCRRFVELSGNGHQPHVAKKSESVRVAEDADVVEGSLVLSSSVLCVCGVWFIPTVWNQKYHTKACRRMARKRRAKRGENENP